MFTDKKIEDIDTFVCAVSLYVADTPKASIKDQEPSLPIIPFGIVAYGLLGQPFSKQLCTCRKGCSTKTRLLKVQNDILNF